MSSFITPYYAVIFTSRRKVNIDGYAEMSLQMQELAAKQKGFLGVDSAHTELGITVSYWESLEAIRNWKQQSDHLHAQQKGRTHWYSWYNVRICKVEREYEFSSS
ncbi:MAG: antibiotic biosynthesis monooxygenase [Bacteroidia bacterium]|nr:antibiotic biosynthesis monooxygenase [Bacteroidia bacterium]NND52652.1 antibiotic biosynthesis monooxygenase [Flavobacteriaceae bacterium]